MAEPLKNLYSDVFFTELCAHLKPWLPQLDREQFRAGIYTAAWDGLELKQRTRHTTEVLHTFMPADFPRAAAILGEFSIALSGQSNMNDTLPYLCLADYVAVYGMEHPEAAFAAMAEITQFITCEFAVRPFLLRFPERTIAKMTDFSEHPHIHVRRFASEGVRPRLPWGVAIPFLKQDPAPILPILRRLHQDPADWVRLSVANNLNDICKDNPDTALALARTWKGRSPEADKVVKHGLRTLLKAGDQRALSLIGWGDATELGVRDFSIQTPEIVLGDNAVFRFVLANESDRVRAVRLEYGVYYRKANGTNTRKVFKLSEIDLGPGQTRSFERKQHFRPISTRKYHAGMHRIAVIINGVEKAEGELNLVI
ncbi:MAG: DNA alkylation repair protein [Bacteroidota bacterium]